MKSAKLPIFSTGTRKYASDSRGVLHTSELLRGSLQGLLQSCLDTPTQRPEHKDITCATNDLWRVDATTPNCSTRVPFSPISMNIPSSPILTKVPSSPIDDPELIGESPVMDASCSALHQRVSTSSMEGCSQQLQDLQVARLGSGERQQQLLKSEQLQGQGEHGQEELLRQVGQQEGQQQQMQELKQQRQQYHRKHEHVQQQIQEEQACYINAPSNAPFLPFISPGQRVGIKDVTMVPETMIDNSFFIPNFNMDTESDRMQAHLSKGHDKLLHACPPPDSQKCAQDDVHKDPRQQQQERQQMLQMQMQTPVNVKRGKERDTNQEICNLQQAEMESGTKQQQQPGQDGFEPQQVELRGARGMAPISMGPPPGFDLEFDVGPLPSGPPPLATQGLDADGFDYFASQACHQSPQPSVPHVPPFATPHTSAFVPGANAISHSGTSILPLPLAGPGTGGPASNPVLTPRGNQASATSWTAPGGGPTEVVRKPQSVEKNAVTMAPSSRSARSLTEPPAFGQVGTSLRPLILLPAPAQYRGQQQRVPNQWPFSRQGPAQSPSPIPLQEQSTPGLQRPAWTHVQSAASTPGSIHPANRHGQHANALWTPQQGPEGMRTAPVGAAARLATSARGPAPQDQGPAKDAGADRRAQVMAEMSALVAGDMDGSLMLDMEGGPLPPPQKPKTKGLRPLDQQKGPGGYKRPQVVGPSSVLSARVPPPSGQAAFSLGAPPVGDLSSHNPGQGKVGSAPSRPATSAGGPSVQIQLPAKDAGADRRAQVMAEMSALVAGDMDGSLMLDMEGGPLPPPQKPKTKGLRPLDQQKGPGGYKRPQVVGPSSVLRARVPPPSGQAAFEVGAPPTGDKGLSPLEQHKGPGGYNRPLLEGDAPALGKRAGTPVPVFKPPMMGPAPAAPAPASFTPQTAQTLSTEPTAPAARIPTEAYLLSLAEETAPTVLTEPTAPAAARRQTKAFLSSVVEETARTVSTELTGPAASSVPPKACLSSVAEIPPVSPATGPTPLASLSMEAGVALTRQSTPRPQGADRRDEDETRTKDQLHERCTTLAASSPCSQRLQPTAQRPTAQHNQGADRRADDETHTEDQLHERCTTLAASSPTLQPAAQSSQCLQPTAQRPTAQHTQRLQPTAQRLQPTLAASSPTHPTLATSSPTHPTLAASSPCSLGDNADDPSSVGGVRKRPRFQLHGRSPELATVPSPTCEPATGPSMDIFTGFQTCKGTAVNIDPARLAAMAQKLQVDEQLHVVDALLPSPPAPTSAAAPSANAGTTAVPSSGTGDGVFTGFQTCKGNAVNIDPARLAAMKQRLQVDEPLPDMEALPPSPPAPTSAAATSASAGNTAGTTSGIGVGVFTGFQTCKGTAVNIDPARLAAMKQRLQIDEPLPDMEALPPPPPALTSANAGTTAVTSSCTGVGAFTGFQTCKGNAVKIDPARLAAMKQRLQEDEPLPDVGALPPSPPAPTSANAGTTAVPSSGTGVGAFTGFQTCKGNAVNIDPARLAAMKQKLRIDEPLPGVGALPPSPPAPTSAVATSASAGTTAVPISRFGDGVFTGFQTCKGNAVNIDPARLAAMKQRLQVDEPLPDVDALPPPPPAPTSAAPNSASAKTTAVPSSGTGVGIFTGFQTCKGNAVNIDPARLAAMKQKLQMDTPLPDVDAQPTSPPQVKTGDDTSKQEKAHPPAASNSPLAEKSHQGLQEMLPTDGALPSTTIGDLLVSTPAPKGITTPLQQQLKSTGAPGMAGSASRSKDMPAGTSKSRLPGRSAPSKRRKQFRSPLPPNFTLRSPAVTPEAQAPKKQRLEGLPQAASSKVSLKDYFDIHCPPCDVDACEIPVVEPQVLNMNPDRAATFVFEEACETLLQESCLPPMEESGAHNTWGPSHARSALLAAGAEPDKASEEWVSLQYRWIVWKLASYERRFPQQCSRKALTRQAVEEEMKRRYQHEHIDQHHPILRQLAEFQLSVPPSMVLMVGAVQALAPSPDMSSSSKPLILSLTGRKKATPLSLHCRYQHEHIDQHHPILRQLAELQLSVPPSMVLMVSAVQALAPSPDMSGSSWKLELSDGWYRLPARLDHPLSDLAGKGKIKVGCKLRVVGAQLDGARAMDPFEAFASGACHLVLHSNGCSPASWDAKLGAATVPKQLALRHLALVHPEGGTIPHTLLVVQAVYPLQFFTRGTDGAITFRTKRAHDAAASKYETKLQDVHDAALESVQKGERLRCQRLVSSAGCSKVERAYASAVLAAGAGDMATAVSEECKAGLERGWGHGHCRQQGVQGWPREVTIWVVGGGAVASTKVGPAYASTMLAAGAGDKTNADSKECRAGLERYMSDEQARIQELVNAEVSKRMGQARGKGGHNTDGNSAADLKQQQQQPDFGVPVLRIKVSSVGSPEVGHGPQQCSAIITIWRPVEDQIMMKEGDVMLVSNLQPDKKQHRQYRSPGTTDHGYGPSARPPLQLMSGSKPRSHWQRMGVAGKLLEEGFKLSYVPRPVLHLASIEARHLGSEFDCCGVLVGASTPAPTGGSSHMWQQWVFVTDGGVGPASGNSVGKESKPYNPQQGRPSHPGPFLLAINVCGPHESVDFVDVEALTTSPGPAFHRATSAAQQRQPQQPNTVVLSSKHQGLHSTGPPETCKSINPWPAFHRATRAAQQHQPQQPNTVVLSFKHLVLDSWDRNNQVWQAVAGEISSHAVVGGTGGGGGGGGLGGVGGLASAAAGAAKWAKLLPEELLASKRRAQKLLAL
eukprot:gene15913-22047_t